MSDKYFNKCSEEINKMLGEAEQDQEKRIALMSCVAGAVFVLMNADSVKSFNAHIDDESCLSLQILPIKVVEMANKAFEEFMSANKPTVQ